MAGLAVGAIRFRKRSDSGARCALHNSCQGSGRLWRALPFRDLGARARGRERFARQFGMTFHVLSPLQDSVGIITPSSLHFVGTHRGAIVPDIDPKEYRLLIHGMVDRPLEFTLAELKRFPSVSRIHFLECLGNRTRPEYKTVQETHGLTSCSEWTGVPLSLLLKEVGVQKGASWVVSEGSEEVKGAGSIRLAKAMDDCLVAYGQNGEAAASSARFSGAADGSRL